jgi:hypothetical protein
MVALLDVPVVGTFASGWLGPAKASRNSSNAFYWMVEEGLCFCDGCLAGRASDWHFGVWLAGTCKAAKEQQKDMSGRV